MAAIHFLSVQDVLQIHRDTIEKDGGSEGLRDIGLLEAAVAMPRQQFGGEFLHEDLVAMAAAYLFHLCQNHPFQDGNKRTAVMAAFVFLDNNGAEIDAAPRKLEGIVLRVAAGDMSKGEVTTWLREHVAVD